MFEIKINDGKYLYFWLRVISINYSDLDERYKTLFMILEMITVIHSHPGLTVIILITC